MKERLQRLSLNLLLLLTAQQSCHYSFPSRVGLEFSLQKQQQQKIIIHSDVPVFKEESQKFSLSLPLWTHPATSIYTTVEVTHKTNQTNLSDLKPPCLMGNRDKTEPCLFVIVCLLFAKTRHRSPCGVRCAWLAFYSESLDIQEPHQTFCIALTISNKQCFNFGPELL